MPRKQIRALIASPRLNWSGATGRSGHHWENTYFPLFLARFAAFFSAGLFSAVFLVCFLEFCVLAMFDPALGGQP